MIENARRTKYELANRIVICIAIILAILFFIPKKQRLILQAELGERAHGR